MKTMTIFRTGFFTLLLHFTLTLVYTQNANALNICAARMGGGPDTIKPVISNPDADSNNKVKVQKGSVFVDRTIVTDDVDQPVLLISQGSDQVETGFTGFYYITYNATDLSGNKADTKTYIYIVNDYIPPVIHLNTSDTIVWPLNKPYTPEQPLAYDSKYGLVHVKLVISTVDPSKPGLYYDEYTAEDVRGNKSLKRRYVQVVEGGPAGIAVPDQTPAINFYPNPSLGIVYMGYDFNTPEHLELEVYNTAGELVEKKSGIFGQNGTLTIDLGDKAKGIYLLKLKSGHSEISRKVSIR